MSGSPKRGTLCKRPLSDLQAVIANDVKERPFLAGPSRLCSGVWNDGYGSKGGIQRHPNLCLLSGVRRT
jgi:hypothetical protein